MLNLRPVGGVERSVTELELRNAKQERPNSILLPLIGSKVNVNRKEEKGKEEKEKGEKAEEAAEDTLQKVVKAAKAKAVEKGKETKGYVSTSTTEMGIAGSGQTAISVTTSSQRYSWDQQTKEVAQSQTRRRRKGRKCTRQPWWLS